MFNENENYNSKQGNLTGFIEKDKHIQYIGFGKWINRTNVSVKKKLHNTMLMVFYIWFIFEMFVKKYFEQFIRFKENLANVIEYIFKPVNRYW